jgi:DUF438 domain-containing protein
MAEYINNREQRRQVLEGLIRQLHEGRSVEEVKDEFARVLGEVGASELAAVEQALITGGVPETEVKRLCDVHVAVFRDSLDAQTRPEVIPGHPVHTFLAENVACARVLDDLGAALAAVKSDPTVEHLETARMRLRELRQYEKHYLRKENILFPFLEKKGFSGPTRVMWAIHDDIRASWKALEQVLADPPADPAALSAQLDGTFLPLDKMIREMFFKEETILFPTALEMLNHDEWLEIRQHEPDTGYAYVDAGNQWPPESPVGVAPAGAEAPLDTTGLLRLDTGALTLEEVNRLLAHLPVDITFVDKDDRVRFFSQTKDRIFPRSPAIIGRKVQQCHPPASVHKVQRILDDFRAGRRDTADFWIQMRGRFIYIAYYAVRDGQGEYQGTVEVTQDLTRLRALEGERRLLDE